MANILGINRTSDASICLIKNSSEVVAVAKERLTRKKHDWGKLGDIKNLYIKSHAVFATPVDIVVECYSSDAEYKNIAQYQAELEDSIHFSSKPNIVQISHHLAHVYSGFFPSPFNEAAVLVCDFQGSHAEQVTENFPGKKNVPLRHVEVISYYACKAGEVQCLNKQFWDGRHEAPKGLGTFYARLTQCLFPGIGNEGIVMGLAPYGNEREIELPQLEVIDGHVSIPQAWIDLFINPSKYSFFIDGSGTFQDAANLAAAGQKAYERALLSCVQWLHESTGLQNIIIVGGCALNCSANAKVTKHSPFKNVFIPPATHDGGTSLGCALYGLIHVLGKVNEFKWKTDSLGPVYNIESFAHSLADHEFVEVERPANIIQAVSDALIGGEVLGIYQGGSEFGPRALGHRSIIADARHGFITNYINDKIKKRQWFRPLSPMVLDSDKHHYFNFDRSSSFMLFAVEVKPEAKRLIPAVVHVDDSARIQTITEAVNPFFFDLLSEYKKKTGISVILNTSFNGKTEPIVETPEDALNCFLSTPLNRLIMPPYIIHKKKREKNPLHT